MNTAAEPMSLASPASTCRSKPMRSTVASMALLSSSTMRMSSIGRDQQRALHAAVPEPQAQGYDERRQGEFLAKRRLLAKGAREPVQRSSRTARSTRVSPRGL